MQRSVSAKWNGFDREYLSDEIARFVFEPYPSIARCNFTRSDDGDRGASMGTVALVASESNKGMSAFKRWPTMTLRTTKSLRSASSSFPSRMRWRSSLALVMRPRCCCA